MSVPFIDLQRQYLEVKTEVDNAIKEVLAGGWYIGGAVVAEFEQKFAEYIGVKQCISCGNCTDGLELLLRAYGIGPGDEVIVPAFTWITDAEVVSLVGAKVVFADILSDEYTIDPVSIESQITEKTKAIIVVHLYGRPCRMEAIMALADRYNLKVIEDCAQAAGAKYNHKRVGAIGHAAAFSFYPTKNLGAYGDGGAVTTNDEALATKLRLMANHGQKERDNHIIEGKNSRLDPIQAAALLIKLKYLDQWNNRRKVIAAQYTSQFSEMDGIICPQPSDDHIYHIYGIRVENREALKAHLSHYKIQTAIHYPKALPELAAYSHLKLSIDQYPVSGNLASQELSLPVFPELTNDEVAEVIRGVGLFFDK
ncbi:DegT/DnrJ/EryC1/StrS family aminotransferase [Fulvivirga sediminis]|uniref:DegT/DnrJ/EryC1/StrS family aminotransferase n=1 Tax=Fulvivirga sediminis TaxID=2803949 RepID=A0A937F3G0_9BACT|nr:DegT/DnrJ/EryC1/StrS family aminotransferase [Fulvivirga sediminis]MBL3655641.1 DegT/DnrJ/EryC1/StrS family aminotransferase [Fulvivirga sediminis]